MQNKEWENENDREWTMRGGGWERQKRMTTVRGTGRENGKTEHGMRMTEHGMTTYSLMS
jgi:hypothetical protein